MYIHCKPVKQTVWIVTCRNDPLWASLKNYDLAQIYSTVKTVPFCTKLILKIYTHTAYFTYSIANLRKRSVASTHFLFPLKASLFWFKRAIRVQRQYFQCCIVQNKAARPQHENKPHTKHIVVPVYHTLYTFLLMFQLQLEFWRSERDSMNHSSVCLPTHHD